MRTVYKTKKRPARRLPVRDRPTRRQVVAYRILDENLAKKEIMEFIRNNPRCTTSQIISKLRMNPEQVAEILDELERDGIAYGKLIE